ncbi:MAG: hypothetical protein HY716_04435 [Planctomycetes bacterium]|nr:hypothetical protein [Planctomycetota bacterium]
MKWVLIGCGVLAGVGILACGGCFAFGYYLYRQVAPIIEEATAFAKNNEIIAQEIGEPKDGGFHVRKWDFKNDVGRVEIHIQGDKGEGDIVVNFRKEEGRWRIVGGTLTKDGQVHPLRGTEDTSE